MLTQENFSLLLETALNKSPLLRRFQLGYESLESTVGILKSDFSEHRVDVALLKYHAVETIKKLDEHTSLLTNLTIQTGKNSKKLDEHSAILDEHSKTLAEHTQTLREHSILLRELRDSVALILRNQQRDHAIIETIGAIKEKCDLTYDLLLAHIADKNAHRPLQLEQ